MQCNRRAALHVSDSLKLSLSLLTGLAMRPVLSLTQPSLPSWITAPMGAVSAVAVTTVTDSHRAHNDDNASPLNPKVVTRGREDMLSSLDV